MWVGEPPTVSQGFRAPGQEGQRGFHSDALNHSQLLRFLKGPPWCGPKRRPQATAWKSLQRRGGRERPLPRGTSQRAAGGHTRNAEAARDGAPEQRREASDDREACSARGGWGASGCRRVPSRSSPFSGLAILGPWRGPSSRCTTQRDLVSDDKAGQSLTKQCHSSPSRGNRDQGHPQASGALSSVREGPFTGRGLWIRAT